MNWRIDPGKGRGKDTGTREERKNIVGFLEKL